jgi:hypothetical protein
MLCVAGTHEKALAYYNKTVAVLDAETQHTVY